jgi:hypothetical protein
VAAKNKELREMSADPLSLHPVLKLTQSLQASAVLPDIF